VKKGVNSLINYFLNCTRLHEKQVIEKYMTNERYDEIRDLDVFRDEYFKALK